MITRSVTAFCARSWAVIAIALTLSFLLLYGLVKRAYRLDAPRVMAA